MLTNYFNRRLLAGYPAKLYAKLLYRGRQFVESAEANEAQDVMLDRLRSVGDATLGTISLRDGGTIVVNRAEGKVTLGAARVWAGGYMHNVPAAEITGVSMAGTVPIGIAVTETIVTEVEDPELAGMVPDTASHGQPLAARLRYDAVWATGGDSFYPIHTLVDGQLPNEVIAPLDASAELAVERHLRETHGSHIVDGFQVSAGGFVGGAQVFIIGAGTLRAEGRRVRRTADQRFVRAEDPELVQVNGEPQTYPAGGVVTLSNGPIDNVQTVTVIKEVTHSITHTLAGGADALPNTPVYAIMSVKQGGTTYVAGTDYKLTADRVDWSPSGAEPSPGSSYDVTYRYVATVVPSAISRNTITLEAAVVGLPVVVNYRYKLRRIDVLAIDEDGAVVYLKGISTKMTPVPPTVPAPLAPLVRVENRWGIDPILTDVDQRKLTEAEVRAMMRTMLTMYDQLSLVSMERDIQERDPASRRGSFVDPFRDDNQRDLGIAQDAAIIDGILTLPIEVTPLTVDIGSLPIMLPYVSEPVLSQPWRTLSRKINAYMAFEPLPAALKLQPAIDRWNENQSSQSSSATKSMAHVASYRPDLLDTPLYGTTSYASTVSTSVSSSRSSRALPNLRSIPVTFTCERMGPGEGLDRLLFDSIDITHTVTGSKLANGAGVMTGSFMIPAGVKAGTKEVEVVGTGGTRGKTSFTGQGTLTTTHYHTTTHTHTVATTIDPVAQSFVLDQTRQVTGARVEFTVRGNPANPVALEMRPMADGGLPGRETLAEGIIGGGEFNISDPLVDRPENWTELSFRFPAFTPAGEYRWIALLTADAEHSVAVAQLGDQSDPNAPRGYDSRRQEWIRQNTLPGDFADGSNGVSWKLQPDTDLTCQIMAARYTATTRTVIIGEYDLEQINAGGISDILVLLLVEQPSDACRVRLEMVREGGEVVAFEPGVSLHLDEYLTETVTIRMVLTGTATLSPVVMPECQIMFGRLKETASYISEAIALDQTHGNLRVRSVLEAMTPGASSITAELGADGAWASMGSPATLDLGDGWIEREYLRAPVTTLETRQKITLTGTPAARPAVRRLRVRATEV